MGAQMDVEGNAAPLASEPIASSDTPPEPYSAPHIPDKCKAGLIIANAGKPLAELGAEPILARLRCGEKARAIAAELGVSDVAMYAYLLRNAPTEWLELSAGRSLARLDKAADDLDTAEDQLTVSRARESARLAQWDLERANRKLYGDNKQDASGGVTVQVIIDRGVEYPGVTIEAQR